jgi:hypothetical protein
MIESELSKIVVDIRSLPEQSLNMKSIKYYLFVFFCILFASCFDAIPEPHSLEYKETFDILAKDIISQKAIFEMDDFTRHHKSVNGVFVYLGNKPDPIDTLAVQATNRSYKPLNQVLDSLNIVQVVFDDFRQRLEETKLREFYKSNDSVLFIVDGFLDDSWGLMYSNNHLDSNREAFQFGDYTVNLLDSINKNWRRASIH